MIRQLAALALIATTAHAQPAPRYRDILPEDMAITRAAYAVFQQHCPGLGYLGPFIESINVWDVGIVMDDDARKNGWKTGISVQVRYRQDAYTTETLLHFGLLNAAGFMLGQGTRPGALAPVTAMRACVADTSSEFMPMPEMRFPARWPSDVADEKAHPHRKLDGDLAPLSAD